MKKQISVLLAMSLLLIAFAERLQQDPLLKFLRRNGKPHRARPVVFPMKFLPTGPQPRM